MFRLSFKTYTTALPQSLTRDTLTDPQFSLAWRCSWPGAEVLVLRWPRVAPQRPPRRPWRRVHRRLRADHGAPLRLPRRSRSSTRQFRRRVGGTQCRRPSCGLIRPRTPGGSLVRLRARRVKARQPLGPGRPPKTRHGSPSMVASMRSMEVRAPSLTRRPIRWSTTTRLRCRLWGAGTRRSTDKQGHVAGLDPGSARVPRHLSRFGTDPRVSLRLALALRSRQLRPMPR